MLTGFLFLCCRPTFIVGPTLFSPAWLCIYPQNKRDVHVYNIYIIYYMVFFVLTRFGPIEDST